MLVFNPVVDLFRRRVRSECAQCGNHDLRGIPTKGVGGARLEAGSLQRRVEFVNGRFERTRRGPIAVDEARRDGPTPAFGKNGAKRLMKLGARFEPP
jgi:hypothetical protein